jgi:hypothetical protein
MGTFIDRPWFLSDLEMGRNPEFLAKYRVRQKLFDLRRFFFAVTVHYPMLRAPLEPFTWYERMEK